MEFVETSSTCDEILKDALCRCVCCRLLLEAYRYGTSSRNGGAIPASPPPLVVGSLFIPARTLGRQLSSNKRKTTTCACAIALPVVDCTVGNLRDGTLPIGPRQSTRKGYLEARTGVQNRDINSITDRVRDQKNNQA